MALTLRDPGDVPVPEYKSAEAKCSISAEILPSASVRNNGPPKTTTAPHCRQHHPSFVKLRFQWKHGSYLTLTVRLASAITSIVTSAAGSIFGWRSNPGPGPNATQVSAAAAAESGPNRLLKPRWSLQVFFQPTPPLSHP